MSKVTVVSMREYINRKSEIFRRIRPSQLAEILSEGEDDKKRGDDEKESEKERYVLLDVRSEEHFGACHIRNAMNFPAQNLRADKTAGIYPYKTRMRKDKDFLFIIYDNDERIAVNTASTLVEKGWEGVLILTKGLTYFAEKFPDFIVGDAPTAFTPRSVMHTGRSRARAGGRRRRAGK